MERMESIRTLYSELNNGDFGVFEKYLLGALGAPYFIVADLAKDVLVARSEKDFSERIKGKLL